MPSGAGKSKEDTWKTTELEKHLREAKDDKAKSSKKTDGSDGREREKRRQDDGERKDRDRERRHREDRESKDRDVDKERRRREEPDKSRSSKRSTEEPEEKKSHRRRDDEAGADVKEKKHRSKEETHTKESSNRDGEKDRKEKRHSRDEIGEKTSSKTTKERTRDSENVGSKHSEERRHRKEEDGSGEKSTKHRTQDKEGKEKKGESHKSSKEDGRRERNEENGKDHEKRTHRSRDDEDRHREKKEKSAAEERTKKPAKVKAEDDYEDNYEDDFENYEDDFDDDKSSEDEKLRVKESSTKHSSTNSSTKKKQTGANGNSEMDEILRAIVEENDRLLSPVQGSRSKTVDKSTSGHNKTAQSSTAQSSQSFINFGTAKRRNMTNKAASKLKCRAKDLLDIIELERVGHSLFEFHPAKEYDLFIQSFGQSNTTQAFVQTNDDSIDRDIQTEDVVTKEKWTQHPTGVDIPAFGGDVSSENKEADNKLLDSVSLSKFIQKSGQVIAALLEENAMDYVHNSVGHKQSNIVVSEAFTELAPVSILKGRHCTNSTFSPVHSHLLLAAYSNPDSSTSDKSGWTKGLVCVWNVYEPRSPNKVLVCHVQPTCCCFSPSKPTLAFSGLVDGSVVVWDLRESSALHRLLKDEDDAEFYLRQPTYNTAGVLNHENHQSPVITIVPITASAAGTRSDTHSSNTSADGGAFQLATLDAESVINLWIVADLGLTDAGGSLSDLGLRPNGRVQLVKSSKIVLENPFRQIQSKFQSFDLQVLPSNNTHYFVASDGGCVIHGLRHGAKVSPKSYRAASDVPVKVLSLDFSPFQEPVFLAGCDDGSLQMYHVDYDQPIISWQKATESNQSISLVRWCRSRPSVFFVIDSDSNLYIWDLNMDDAAALKHERISPHSSVTSLCLSNDYSATGQGLPGRPPQMVVFFENGVAEAHMIKKQFSALMPDEVDKFALLVQTMAA